MNWPTTFELLSNGATAHAAPRPTQNHPAREGDSPLRAVRIARPLRALYLDDVTPRALAVATEAA